MPPVEEATPVTCAVIADISNFKSEYLEMEVHSLEAGELKNIRLADYRGMFVAILFYEADFTPLIREELLDMIDKFERFKQANCQILACSADSAHVHMAWQNTNASEEADGLGRKTPFPLLGDKTQRLCRSLGVLDEEKGTARHALLLLNGDGDLIHREMLDRATKVNLEFVFAAIASAPIGTSKKDDIREVSNGGSEEEGGRAERDGKALSFAVETVAEEDEDLVEVSDVPDSSLQQKSDDHHHRAEGKDIHEVSGDAIEQVDKPAGSVVAAVTVHQQPEVKKKLEKVEEEETEVNKEESTLDSLKKELEKSKAENSALTLAPQVKGDEDRSKAKTAATPSAVATAKTTSPPKKKKDGGGCCVLM